MKRHLGIERELPSFGRSARHRPPGSSERRWFPLLPRKAITIQSNQQIRNKWAVLDSISGLVSRWGVFPLSSSSFFLHLPPNPPIKWRKSSKKGCIRTKDDKGTFSQELHGTSWNFKHTHTLSFSHSPQQLQLQDQFLNSSRASHWWLNLTIACCGRILTESTGATCNAAESC